MSSIRWLVFCLFILVIHFSCNSAYSTRLKSSSSQGPKSSDFIELTNDGEEEEEEVHESRSSNESGAGRFLENFDAAEFSRQYRSRRQETTSNSSYGHDKDNTTTLHVQVTAIHVAESEFPLSKLLFKLTLRLALSEAIERLAGVKKQQQQIATTSNGNSRQVSSVKLSLSVRSANTCARQFAGALAAEEFYLRRARLFIVSGCDDAIRAVSRLASHWRVPVLTAAGFGGDLEDKSVHKTLVRVAFSLRAAVEFLFKLLKSFNWRRVNLIVDESDSNSVALAGSIEQLAAGKLSLLTKNSSDFSSSFKVALNKRSLDLTSLLEQRGDAIKSNKTSREQHEGEDQWPNEMSRQVIEETLWQCSVYSRVTILLLPQALIRRFMLAAYDQQMANGHYTFINMPLLAMQQSQSPSQSQEQADNSASNQAVAGASSAAATGENAFIWRSLRSSRARNAQAKQAFESLMSIYLRTPTTKAYVYFSSKLNNLASNYSMLAQKNASSLAPSTGNKRFQLDINPYSASFYDSLQIYAWALNESISREPLKNSEQLGREVHERVSELVRARRFSDMVTGNLYINSNGDRETDYTLDDMNQMTGKFGPVIMYRGETRDIERLARIHWSSDASVGPTNDQVDCALINTCTGKPMTSKLTLESQLVDHWWRIHLSELELVTTRRKRANDGSLIMSGGGGCNESGGATSELGDNRLMIATSGRRSNANTIVGGGGGGGGPLASGDHKTEVTRATDNSAEWGVSAADVCYGNISLALYKLGKVALKPISRLHQSRKLMIELRSLKEVNHNNLCRFVGILVDEGSLALVSEFCAKGSLREFLHNESMVIDWTFKYSIINDIMAGLQYLHSSPLQFHGRLKSSNCLVSARFVVKLGDYGPHSLYEQLDELEASSQRSDNHQDDDCDSDYDDWLKGRLWMAPEVLKSSSASSARADVYSLGLLLYEIITNSLPFYDTQREEYVKRPLYKLHQEIKTRGASDLMAPLISSLDDSNRTRELESERVKDLKVLIELMSSCWQLEPSKRPSLQSVSGCLKRITRGVTSKKLLENLTSRMEQYTNNLESLVEAKLATLMEEKLKTEELLYQFVPKSIASLLKEGQFVEPEAFECVTVFYSDIVGFTSLSSQSSPMEVVGFLGDLYQCFDQVLEQHLDIFKVDTIGDAYIVASGLPQRMSDDKHVVEIACAALELRDNLKRFKIPHKPEHSLEMRAGIHSGPCVAGIVGGLNMPKYCVFGDTLTTGKFMESSGLPMKIHITEESRRLLANSSGFQIEPRTPRITRDGLPLQTYWLERA